MQLTQLRGEPTTQKTDHLVIAVPGTKALKSPALKQLNQTLGGKLLPLFVSNDFKANAGQVLSLPTLGMAPAAHLSLVGVPADGIDASGWVDLGATAARVANQTGAKQAVVMVVGEIADDRLALRSLARGIALGAYRFDTYRSEPSRKATLAKVALSWSSTFHAASAAEGFAVAEGVSLARDLVNESPLQLYPETFARRAQSVAKQVGLTCKVMKPDELKRRKMDLLLGVGAGSAQTPRLVHLTYTPAKAKKGAKPIVLVGKGITFDSGGLCLKPGGPMAEMKIDMGGAAAVLGAMLAVGKLKPNFPVHGLLALAENMPSGTAIRPGDVLTSAAGKTVEVNNTDAEGRLVLADALNYGLSLKPKYMLDFATLTGACMVALGPNTCGVFSNDDELGSSVLAASSRSGEDMWRLPLTKSLRSQLDSDVADLKNTGERWGGAITAALFLKEFVGDCTWAHFDIAGPTTSTKDKGAFAKGGTGVAVATIAELLLH